MGEKEECKHTEKKGGEKEITLCEKGIQLCAQ